MSDTPVPLAGPGVTQAAQAEAAKTGATAAKGGAFAPPGLAWAIFELARNPYYVLINIYIFAPYFGEVIGQQMLANGALSGLPPEEAEQIAGAEGLATIASVTKWAGFIAAFTAPFLGAALDRGGRRKPLMAVFLGMLALASWNLWYAAADGTGYSIAMVMAIMVVGHISYTYSEVTHNAMLNVAGRPQSLPMISGLGLGLGNLAAAVLLLALVLLFALPDMIGWPFAQAQFGIDVEAGEHRRLVGPVTAVWLVIFVIPFFLFARDGGTPGASWPAALSTGAKGLFRTLRRAKEQRNVLTFLGARMLYADAMAALLTLSAVYVTLFFKWTVVEMTVYAIVSSIFAFFGGLIGGRLDQLLGPKRALIVEISVMLATLILQLSITPDRLFFGLMENRPVWGGFAFQELSDVVFLSSIAPLAISATASISSSRSMLVHLAPPARVGEFFGLYAIAGTVTVWLGPLLVEIFARAFDSQRIGMSAISLLFIAGLVVLMFVKADKTPEYLKEGSEAARG